MWPQGLLVQGCLRQTTLHHAKLMLRRHRSKSASALPSSDNTVKAHASVIQTDCPRKQTVVKKGESGKRKLKIYPPPSLMNCQSVVLPGPERIHASGATDTPEKFIEFPDEKTHTICDTIITGLHKSLTGECLGIRSPVLTGKYAWISYAELSIRKKWEIIEQTMYVTKRKDYIGSGLLNLGVPSSHKGMVGICTKTRPEFVLVMLACSRYSMVLVPLYHCFGEENIAYIVDQVQMEVMFCETPEFAADILNSKHLYPSLKHIVVFDGNEDEIAKLNTSDLGIISLKELEIRGKVNFQKPEKPKPDDLFCICYTSGTTGTPKGVMITHRNILSCIASFEAIFGDIIPYNESLMCYLPCAHIYEIVNEVYCLFHGSKLGFYSGNTETLMNDLAELKPAVLPLVPKLMNLIYAGVKKKIGQNSIRRYLLRLSIQQKEKTLQKGIISKTGIWDRLFFAKIQRLLGGSIQMIFTASAPVSKEVMQFFRCSMGCSVFEVYGLSEVGAAAMTLMAEHDSGFVGPPLPCNHIKLVSVPEMSYFAENDEGEICIRGANVFAGYYKNEIETKEALDTDGWFHSGDIGKWLPNGALKITDRKKHIFKLAQGEYIIPEKIESTYMENHIVSQVYVDGHSDQEFVVGIVVPEKQVFLKWAKRKGFEGDFETLCQNKEVKAAVLEDLWKIGKKRNLNSLQQVGNILLTTEAFSQDNGLLTPTLKLKRSSARQKFEQDFLALYKEGNLRPSKRF
ncbi:hypothetical protein CDAR_87882 [Caerostris darwini]|uniref:long-chain-fatty-acid--CoA ligase n=1 Tax=Caerostris darwini TaxID=1538125 RepID=A0AAV4S957_9ARAC|nr:hypothetical protein CDAR_87882 [Caerostris darwini]